MKHQIWVYFLLSCLLATSSSSQNLSQCSWDLNQLSQTASQTGSLVNAASSAQDRYKRDFDELEMCIKFPDIYDLLNDGCQSKRNKALSSQRNFEHALSSLDLSFSSLNRSLRSVSQSCDLNTSLLLGNISSNSSNSTAARANPGYIPPPSGKGATALAAGVLAIGVIAALNAINNPTKPTRTVESTSSALSIKNPIIKRQSEPQPVYQEITIPAKLHVGIPAMTNASRSLLGDERLVILADLVGSSPAEVQSLRWGKSASPKTHRLWKTTYYNVQFSRNNETQSLTFYTDEDGNVLFKKAGR
jgi:hypothetical protein